MSLLLSATQKFVAREGGNTRNKNNLSLQRNIVERQVARKCCPYYWALIVKYRKYAKYSFIGLTYPG